MCFKTRMLFLFHINSGSLLHNFDLVSVGGCFQEAWRGDGSCDDGNNNVDCNFDDGDCCGSCVNREYCTDCLCLFEDLNAAGD